MIAPLVLARMLRALAMASGLAGALLVSAWPECAAQERVSAVTRGDAAWQAQRWEDARSAYAEVVAADSMALQPLFRLATLRLWENKLGESARLFRRYVQLAPSDPDGAIALGRVLGLQGNYEGALLVLEPVVRANPENRDAVFMRGQVLGWGGRYDASIQAYARWLGTHPDDREASLALARTYSWAGRLSEAESRYRAIAAEGTSLDAEKGLARVTAWRGELDRSAQRWRALVDANPNDPESLTGLAQVERWRGHPAIAIALLEHAMAVAPGYSDAREQWQWASADLKPYAAPLYGRVQDSDGNLVQTLQVGIGGATSLWPGTVQVIAQARDATIGSARGTSIGARGIGVWTPTGGQWTVGAEAGLAQLQDTRIGGFSAVAASALVRVRGQLRPTVTAGLTLATQPFDETAPLIASGIRTTLADAEMSLRLPSRVYLSAGLGWMGLTGDTANSRLSASANARWVLVRGSSVALEWRTLGYRKRLQLGYFSPQRFATMEAQAHFELPKDLGWNLILDAAVGSQTIRFDGTPAASRGVQRVGAGVVWRPLPGYETSLTLNIANVASPVSVNAEYRAGGLQWRGRLRF